MNQEEFFKRYLELEERRAKSGRLFDVIAPVLLVLGAVYLAVSIVLEIIVKVGM